MNQRLRVASLQYFIRPVKSFDQFEDQVVSLLETVRDYKCQLAVFPEYFTVQLLTLGNVKRPINEQIRDLAAQRDRFIELFSRESKRLGLYIVAGTIPIWSQDNSRILNASYVFGPSGEHVMQGKLHMTRFEKEEWFVSAAEKIKIIETSFGKMAINICYDVEFPELARAAAKLGATLLITPSCTDDRQGWLRVRYCAQARAIENQLYVIQSSTVGSLPQVPAVSLNYGQSSILTPSDFSFARDGILAEGNPNQETIVIGELDLAQITLSRERGTVLPLKDSYSSQQIASQTEEIQIS